MKKIEESLAVGRRKRAIASVRLRKGTGQVKVNGKAVEDYFPLEIQRKVISAPLEEFECKENYDVIVRVRGGGIEGQVIAVRLGISRALVGEDQERRGSLKSLGFLTRDPRKKERKKYGLAGARRKFQFSKR